MILNFTKMHGLGNDFVVVNAMQTPFNLTTEQIKQIANRRFGVGCDQLLVVEPSTHDNVDFRYRIFNADGGEVEQCGNGARCFAKYLHDEGLSNKSEIAVETSSGLIVLKICDQGLVTVDMGAPIFTPEQIPFGADSQASVYQIEVEGDTISAGVLSMGNPHVVMTVENIETAPVARLGAALESHPRFPNRVNVGFMQVLDSNHISLRVYERGAGETLACGTGACAAAVFAIKEGLAQSPITVSLRGGDLKIEWSENSHVMMTGPANTVFTGEFPFD